MVEGGNVEKGVWFGRGNMSGSLSVIYSSLERARSVVTERVLQLLMCCGIISITMHL